MRRIKGNPEKVLEFLDESNCYCVSMETLSKHFPLRDITAAIKLMSLTLFMFAKDAYLGTEQGRLDYYADKLAGTNPFYQTW